MKILRLFLLSFLVLVQTASAQRFPAPEFESGYVVPVHQTVAPRANLWEYLDVVVLFVLLSVMTWFVLKKRSRTGIFWTSVVSLLYFGFVRVGCVCSVGSIQNITASLFHSDFLLPLTAVAFFALPLLFTLFFGRVFCAGVCFMGALQDLVNVKPIAIPSWLNKTLSTIPYLYLMLALLLAATGADFIVCRYDPFIGIFRMNATFGMFVFTVLLLGIGVFVGRPYCRFLCPYGVLLNWMSRLSFRHTSITPTTCINCKLCEHSCPYDAIDKPVLIKPEPLNKGRNRLILYLALIPVFIATGGFLASRLSQPLSTTHATVRLAEEIKWEQDQRRETQSEESKAFHASGLPTEQLFATAGQIQKEFLFGTWICGALLGLFFSLALLKTATTRRLADYQPNRGNCYSCGKCYQSCPVDKLT